MSENEIWRPVKYYEGLYEVSNLGRVRSLKRGTVLTPRTTSKYAHVIFSRFGKVKEFSVHRLVAEAFLPNPLNLPCVNHKDENKLNNYVSVNHDGTVDLEKSNLEWCDYVYNNTYGTRSRVKKVRDEKARYQERKEYFKRYYQEHKK